jgi:hypothetical protein
MEAPSGQVFCAISVQSGAWPEGALECPTEFDDRLGHRADNARPSRKDRLGAADPEVQPVSDSTALRDLPTDQWPTRELILREASRLSGIVEVVVLAARSIFDFGIQES